MKTHELVNLLHALKPDGHGANPLATELHKLANAVQAQADKAYEALNTVLNPTFKGDVVGELVDWPGHFPLELDHSEGNLNDIFVRGLSVAEHLTEKVWDEAAAYVEERFGPESSEALSRKIDRMDANDLLRARAA